MAPPLSLLLLGVEPGCLFVLEPVHKEHAVVAAEGAANGSMNGFHGMNGHVPVAQGQGQASANGNGNGNGEINGKGASDNGIVSTRTLPSPAFALAIDGLSLVRCSYGIALADDVGVMVGVVFAIVSNRIFGVIHKMRNCHQVYARSLPHYALFH